MPRMMVTRVSLLIMSASACALGQVTPDRMYYGVGRAVPMTVRWATDAGNDGQSEARVELFRFGGESPVASAPVTAGAINMGSLFPTLWADVSAGVLYAQLTVGEMRVGPPVVLRPLHSPSRAMLYSPEAGRPYYLDPVTKVESIDPKKGELIYIPDPPAFTGICAYVEKHVELNTTAGTIELMLRPDQAPNTAMNFMHLVEGGFYTDIIFHRIVPRTANGHPFVIQVGDPTGGGDGGPGYAIDLEDSKLPHDFGVISMARDTDPNTNGSQVFICLSREGTARLDGRYTAFGHAVSGSDVIQAIGASPVNGDKPIDPPILLSARLIDAPPFGLGPRPVTRPAPPPTAPVQGR